MSIDFGRLSLPWCFLAHFQPNFESKMREKNVRRKKNKREGERKKREKEGKEEEGQGGCMVINMIFGALLES